MTDTNNAQALDGKPNVFISYSRDDLDFADQLNAILQLAGFEVFLDRADIKAGESWESRLGELIQSADTVVFVLSPSSATSDICRWELKEAERLGKRILPVVCRPLEGASPPDLLAALNYIFFYPEPRKSGTGFAPALSELVSALNTDLTWLREHTRYLERASEWDEGGRKANRLLFGADIEAAKHWASRRPKDAPEVLPLHLEFIRSSEEEEVNRSNIERQRLEDMASAQAERQAALDKAESALQDKESAQQRELAASRKVITRTRIGAAIASVLAAISLAIGGYAYLQKQDAATQRDAADKAKVKWKDLALEIKQEYLALLAKGAVTDVVSKQAAPGEIQFVDGAGWMPLIKKNQRTFAAARTYQKGRVLAAGHDDFLVLGAKTSYAKSSYAQQHRELLKRAFFWLEESVEPRDVVIATGHCEWEPTRTRIGLTVNMLGDESVPVRQYAGTINDAALEGTGILVVGNAWGDYLPEEVDSIEKFVRNGGGLLMVGLGWSWHDYSAKETHQCKGKNAQQDIKDLKTYPMNVIGKKFGIEWTNKALQ